MEPKPPIHPGSAEEALRRVQKVPQLIRKEGESDKAWKARWSVAVRNAASRLRTDYKLANVWQDPTSKKFLFDLDEIERKKAQTWTRVPAKVKAKAK
jgi:hypothetical protein